MSESASTPAYQSVSLMRTESSMVHRTAENSSRKGAKESRKDAKAGQFFGIPEKCFLEVPRQGHAVLPRLPVELRRDHGPFIDLTIVVFVKCLAMVRVVDKLSDAETQSTAGEHVGNIVLVTSESRHANRTRNPIRCDLHSRTIFVFVRDNRCHRPCLRAVSGRKRCATIEELTSFAAVHWSRALSDSFERRSRNHTVDQRFRTQQSRFARAIIVVLATNQIESPRNSAEAVNRSGVTDPFTRFDLAIGFEYLVARDSIGGNQRHQTDACRNHPLRIAAFEMKRRSPDRFLITQNVFEELTFEGRCWCRSLRAQGNGGCHH